MKYNTARHRSNVRVFICSFLSYLLVTSQLAPLAVAYGNPRPPKNSPTASEVVPESAAHSAPVPAPLRLSPVAAALTATKTDSFADSDGDGKAEPGEIITYSITITNTGDQPALNVTLNDTVDPVNNNLTLIGSSVHSTPVAFNDAYNVIGNVRILVPDGASDLLGNDTDPENGGNANTGLTITTLAGDNSAPFSGTSTNGGQVTAASGNGSFEYNPPPGFTGTDTFTYTTTDSTGGGTSTATVTLTIANMIWFIQAGAVAGGDGRLNSPFNCYTGTSGGGQTCFSDTAADEAGDNIFLFSGNYTGGFTLLNNQRLIGHGATDSLANIAGVGTPPSFSDTLPTTPAASPVVTTSLAATNAVPLGQGNLLRGFTIGSTTGAKIFGNNFGTLTVGNNTSPDMILNDAGQALNLTNGTFAATSAFSSVATTSSAAGTAGVSLIQVAGTVAFGSTTVSGSALQGIFVNQSTANVNFGNTAVGTGVAGSGGTNAVSLQNNSGGTRTFGTLTIQNINGPSNSAFLSSTGGGANGGGNTVAGTTSISGVAGTGHGIDIQSLTAGTSVSFGNTTVNKASPGNLVNLASNAGNVSFLSLGGTNTNGGGLVGTENTGSITVTNNTGSLTTTGPGLAPALSITKTAAPATPIDLDFGTLSSTNSGSQGINLDRVSGNMVVSTSTTVNNSTGTGIQVQNTVVGGTMTFGATSVTSTGNANVDGPGTGVFLNANAGNVTFGDLDVTPDANERAFHATNNTGSISSASGDIAATGNVTIEIVGLSLLSRTPLNMTLNNVDSTNSNAFGVNINFVSGSFTVNDATLATNIQNPTGIGIQVQNTAAGGTMNFGNTVINGSGNTGAQLGTGANGNAGNITFGDLDITPDANIRAFLAVDNTGTLTTASGDISATGNVTLEILGPAGRTPLAMTLNNLDSTNSTGGGVNINLVSGNFTVNDAGIATNIVNPTGIGLQVRNTAAGGTMNFGNTVISGSGGIGAAIGTAANGNAGNITFADLDITPDANQRAFVAIDNAGTLTVATGDITTSGAGNRAVEIDGPAGRTPINIQFSAITTTSAANSISLVEISGTKFQVTGTTQINSRAGTGIFVDNSTATNIQFGTTNIPNPSAAGGYGIRVEDSSSAVTIASTTISDANIVTAQSDGDSNGVPDTDGDGDAIFLINNTGSFTLSAGTLSNCGNDCIDLRNTSGTLTLTGVTITTPGVDVTGATGAGFGGHGISAVNLTGSPTITGGTISAFNVASRDGLYLINNVATALSLTLQNMTFQNSTGNRGVGITGRSNANMTVTVTSCTFSNISGTALQSAAGTGAGGTSTVNLTVQNSTFQNSPTDGKTNLIAGLVEAGKSNVVIQNNTFNNVFVTASTGEALININNDGTLAGNQLGLNISNNNINNVGSALNNCAGGAVGCRGPFVAIFIFIDDAGNVPSALVVDNNTITNVQQGGIKLDMANTGAPSSAVSAKITNNCIGRLRVSGACTGANAPIGAGVGASTGSGIIVERRRNNSPSGNALISGNTIRNGVGQNLGALNTPGIFARTKANSNLSVTVTNNNVDTNFVGAAEMRFDTNANDAGDIIAPVQCDDITGNVLPAGAIIDINEINGTHNVEQASEAATEAANLSANVTPDAGVTFGVACAAPPALTDPGPGGSSKPKRSAQIVESTIQQPAAAPQTVTVATSDSITSQPFISSPRQELVKGTTSAQSEQSASTQTAQEQPASTQNATQVIDSQPAAAKSKPSPTTSPDLPSPNPPVVVGNNLTWNIGTLPAGQSVTITFQAQVEGPPYTGPAQVSNQGTVTADGGISVQTDDPSTVGGPPDATITPIDIPPDVTISDAKVAEPTSGTTSMLFTVALSTPATGTIVVTYNTANGTATEPGDYNSAVNQTVSFAVGEQLKMIPITVNSDADGAEGDETFTVTISVPPAQGNVVDASGTGTITAANTAGTLLISEVRTSGPGGSADEFVEIYNNSDTPHVVTATNGSTGYGVFKMGANCNTTPILVGTIPNSTTIPARGHFLLTGSTYSLANYGGTNAALGNATLTSDIENDRNVSLFSTTNILALNTTTRFDAVGFGTNTGNMCDLQREGTNLGNLLGSTLQYSFFRKECDFVLGPGCTVPGRPKDVNDNSVDFMFADTAATLVAGAGQRLGAPGPQNLASPLKRDSTISVFILDPSVPSTSPPNRVFDGTSDPANNSTFGTLTVRRRVVNNTGGPVTRLRFRVVELTTAPPPVGIADVRGRTSVTQVGVGPVNDAATCLATGSPTSPPCTVTVQGLTLEQPPNQTMGGGYNSTLSVGTVSVGTPLANGASVNVQILLGLQQTGNFRFLIIVEALP